jgi:hypothetical protein
LDGTNVLRRAATCQGDAVSDSAVSEPGMTGSGALVDLPEQPRGLAWPTAEWARGTAPRAVGVDGLVDDMFDDTDRFQTG